VNDLNEGNKRLQLVKSCYNLLSINFRTVLEKMLGQTVDRLPGETFAKYMLLEARSLALDHLKSEMTNATDVTVGLDGTSKFGHHYSCFDVSLTGDHSMVMGLREMPSGDAETYKKTLETII
jgi:hypothetical protein